MRRRPPPPQRAAFVDTSAFFALLDRNDHRHLEAKAIQQELIGRGTRLLTSSFVLAETHGLLLGRLNHQIATAFLREMENSPTTVVWVTEEDIQRARQVIYRFDDKDFSLTDAVSFVIMGRFGQTTAFTFDHHFAQYGLVILDAQLG